MDIIASPEVAPILVYTNNSHEHHSIAFTLRDEVGNHFGIGSKIVIYYGDDGSRHQMREIQTGGGFISYDAPVAYFGLGDYKSITRVEVSWSTGENSTLVRHFAAGALYILRRSP